MTLINTTIGGFPALRATPNATDSQGPPILFLHGAFTGEDSFAEWLPRFAAAGYEAIAPRRRGRGDLAPADSRRVTFRDHIADAEAVVAALPAPPIIVGHSIGALVAQCIAERHPVRGLVLLASPPPGMLPAQPQSLRWLLPYLPRIVAGKPFQFSPPAATALALRHLPEAERAQVIASMCPESGTVFAALLAGRVHVDPARVTVPVYVAAGGEDRIVSRSVTGKVARLYSATAHVYPGVGHWLLAGPHADELIHDILDWIMTAIAE